MKQAEEIEIVVYHNSRGKQLCKRNGKRITKTLAQKIVKGHYPKRTESNANYDVLYYETNPQHNDQTADSNTGNSRKGLQ